MLSTISIHFYCKNIIKYTFKYTLVVRKLLDLLELLNYISNIIEMRQIHCLARMSRQPNDMCVIW